MCLSTPATETTSTSACSTTRNGPNPVTDAQQNLTTASSCSSNIKDIITNGCNNNNKNNNNSISNYNNNTTCSIIHRKTDDVTAKITKDIDENYLGYNEENSVYKEKLIENRNDSALSDDVKFIPEIRWPDLMAQIYMHAGAIYGIYLLLTVAKFYTFIWIAGLFLSSGIGITAGAHRLWSHKSYTAALPLRLLLIFLFTIAGQRDAYTWALDHRIHHKFSETEADPHNAKRGFFFAHVAWLFLTPHPKVVEKRKVIDMTDLENDKIVMFQRKWYIPLFTTCSIAMPVLVPWYFWNENLWASYWMCFNMRFASTLNVAFFVNSLAHMYGRRPYDKNISPVESPIVSLMALGEGWHNYHHVFPWDYKTGEFGSYSLNLTTGFIDLCAKLGWASGRKSVSSNMITRRAAKCGDGTRFLSDECAHKDQVWGYGDKDISKEDAIELEKMKD